MLLSVIIPTKNRSKLVSDLLDSFVTLNKVDFEWEVLVIDNASTDNTAEISKNKINTLPISIRYIYEPEHGLHNGRHRGAKEAYGEYIAYLDDDMILSSTWLSGLKTLIKHKADAVVGKILPKWESPPPEWLDNMIKESNGLFGYLGLLDFGKSVVKIDPLFVFGGNAFFSKKAIFDLGGFNPDSMPPELIRYRGDGETALMQKFKLKGFTSFYDPKAAVYHIINSNRLTKEYLFKRAYNQGISDSFASIRNMNSLDSGAKDMTIKKEIKGTAAILKKGLKKIPNKIVYLLNNYRRYIFKKKKIETKKPNALEIELYEANRKGFLFHQNEVNKDPELLKWVLKTNYLD